MWPAIIAAAGSLAASGAQSNWWGLGGGKGPEGGGAKKAKHHQLDYDRRRIQAIVDGAKDAGIHPLAALGATSGGGGFAAPVSSGGSQFGLGDAVGSALTEFANLYESDQDRKEREEDRAFQESMSRRRDAIENLRRKEVTPEVRLQRENMALQNQLLREDIATSRTKLAGARAAAIGGYSSGTKLVGPGGITISPDPGRTMAQDAEDQYGEAGDIFFGAGGLLDDVMNDRVGSARIVNPLTRQSPGVWLDVPSLIRRLMASRKPRVGRYGVPIR